MTEIPVLKYLSAEYPVHSAVEDGSRLGIKLLYYLDYEMNATGENGKEITETSIDSGNCDLLSFLGRWGVKDAVCFSSIQNARDKGCNKLADWFVKNSSNSHFSVYTGNIDEKEFKTDIYCTIIGELSLKEQLLSIKKEAHDIIVNLGHEEHSTYQDNPIDSWYNLNEQNLNSGYSEPIYLYNNYVVMF